MRNAEVLIPFLAAVIAILGYMALLLRKAIQVASFFARLPKEHEFLMKTVAQHAEDIHRLSGSIKALVTGVVENESFGTTERH